MSAKIGHAFEDLSVGMSAKLERTVTDADIRRFAEVSGDDNPVHLDEDYARTTRFGGRIAHGMLGAGFISAVLGTQLPGYGTVYLSQSLSFRRPVKIGETIVTEATVTDLQPEKSRVVLKTVCRVGDATVIEGEAVVMVPKRG
jgi:3-hydroxybutyryl-CoA dehydratase